MARLELSSSESENLSTTVFSRWFSAYSLGFGGEGIYELFAMFQKADYKNIQTKQGYKCLCFELEFYQLPVAQSAL